LREEDPYTADYTLIAENRLIINTSRFEIDLNRSREEAIYRSPEQAWGIKVWKDNAPEMIFEESLSEYDFFYRGFDLLIQEFIRKFGFVVVYDIHTYNYRRQNLLMEDSPVLNPDINVGTGNLNRRLWAPVVDHFIHSIANYKHFQMQLDVRENARFKGGFLSHWVHHNFPNRSCVLAIEIKKIFMDEWTGIADMEKLNKLSVALHETIPGVLQMANRVGLSLNQRIKYPVKDDKARTNMKR
jgi:N-formylglutamate amidohydrolase